MNTYTCPCYLCRATRQFERIAKNVGGHDGKFLMDFLNGHVETVDNQAMEIDYLKYQLEEKDEVTE